MIIINSSAPPQSLQNELKPEEIEQLKVSGAGAGLGQGHGVGAACLPSLPLCCRSSV